MAKRFTDTNKLKKKWLRSLEAPYKLLWIYLLDACDHAGIWEVDFEIANIYIGGKVEEKKALKYFGDRIYVFDNGEKWLIVDFIEFQYNKLNEKNPANFNVIRVLRKYDLIDNNLNLKLKDRGLEAPFLGTKEEEEVKEEVIVKEKEKKEEIFFPFDSDLFMNYWEQWKEYKNKEHNFKYKSIQSQQATLKKLSELSNGNEELAIKIIMQSIENGWKGFFNIKQEASAKLTEMEIYKQKVANKLS